ncbi:MAG TPA: AAA family ATPase [Trueperaceae bacterium]
MPNDGATVPGAFTGREDELGRLLHHWERVKAGEGPRVAVLLAEPGLGKTRLAQELYARLVAAEQGGPGYWPATLGAEGDNLRVNPAVEACDGAADLPFLWWGVRLTDPGGHNQAVSGALAGHVEPYLVPHLEPFHRAQRRRRRLVRAARLGGAVAADVVGDLVPFLGLLKKVGEIGLEVKGLHDEWRRDAAPLDLGAVAGAGRASLAERVTSDLGTLFGAGAGVPAVVLLDDLQFSHADPGVTAFVEELTRAMVSGRWPLLLLVTHWEREWRVAGGEAEPDDTPASPAGAALAALAGRGRGLVDVIGLGPVEDLAPLLRRALPGLTPPQERALLERAGGNPRVLDELLRYALTQRGRGLFVGRDPSGQLTERGLDELLSRGSRLEELVARRFEEAPEAVQRALALAALQGQEFEDWLVAEVARELAADEPAVTKRALRASADPHAMTARLAETRAAFAQRVYRTVALDALRGWFDEDEAREALADLLRECLLGRLDVPDDPASVRGTMAAAAAAFEGRPEDARFAAAALHWLVRDAAAAGDVHGAAALARRLAAVLETLGDDQDGDLSWLRDAQGALAQAGDTVARRPLLARLLRLAGDAYDAAVTEWTVSLYLHALLDVAAFHEDAGDEGRAGEALRAALQVVEESAARVSADDVSVLEAFARVHETVAAWHASRGHVGYASELREGALAIVERIAALDPGPEGPPRLAAARVELARLRASAGEWEEAEALVEVALGELRARLGRGGDAVVEAGLRDALDVAAHVAHARGDEAAALDRLEERLAIARRHHDAAPGAPGVTRALAHALARVAELRALAGDLSAAWALACESVELRRSLADRSDSEAVWLGASLYAAAGLAARREEVSLAHGLAREALGVLRPLPVEAGTAQGGEPLAARWHLVRALLAAVPPTLGVEGREAAAALLAEARGLAEGAPEAARGAFAALLHDVATLEELVGSAAPRP